MSNVVVWSDLKMSGFKHLCKSKRLGRAVKEPRVPFRVPFFTFGLGFDDELLALLLQRVGGGAGVGPGEQRGGAERRFLLHPLPEGIGGLPAVHRCGVSAGSAVQGQLSTNYKVHNLGLGAEERRGNYGKRHSD